MAADLITADTSVVVPLLSRWHEAHELAVKATARVHRLPGHVLLETISSLSRLPGGLAAPPRQILALLQARFDGSPLTLSAAETSSLLERIASRGLVGGQVYDALVAASASAADARLLSLDHRAERTYRAIGVDYELLD